MGRIKTTYSEKYYHRRRQVTREEASRIVQEATVIYAVEQAEIVLPSKEVGDQTRVVCVMRFERIVR
jgi:hypothetical protein